MENHIKIATANGPALEVARMLVKNNYESFGEVTLREEFEGSPHAGTKSIYLRAPPWPFKTAHDAQNDLRVVNWPILQLDTYAHQLLMTMQNIVNMPMARAMLVLMPPGGKVELHVDEGGYADATERFHYPIVTNPKVFSTIEDETIHMSLGCVWWFDKSKPHSAENKSEVDRIHLIFDTWKGS